MSILILIISYFSTVKVTVIFIVFVFTFYNGITLSKFNSIDGERNFNFIVLDKTFWIEVISLIGGNSTFIFYLPILFG